jgi:hypothetical protein
MEEGHRGRYRFKSRKKVETTLIAAPLSLIVNPKKAI